MAAGIADSTGMATPLTSDSSQGMPSASQQSPSHGEDAVPDAAPHALEGPGSTTSNENTAMESRIADLEVLIRSLEIRLNMGLAGPPPPPPGIDGLDKPPSDEELNKRNIQFGLNPLYWHEFQDAWLETDVHPIDVLVGDPEPPDPADQPSLVPPPPPGMPMIVPPPKRMRRTRRSREDAQKELQRIERHSMPERIRLSIFALQYLLRMILGPKAEIPHAYEAKGIIMLRPYKQLLICQDILRSKFSQIVAFIDDQETGPTAASDMSDGDGESYNVVPLETQTISDMLARLELSCCEDCTKQLQADFKTTKIARNIIHCFLEFLDRFVVPIHENVRKRKPSRLTYDQLWHLFKPGDHVVKRLGITSIYAQTSYSTVWRVLRVQGGRPQVCGKYRGPRARPHIDMSIPPPPPAPIVEAVNGIVPFSIDIYYLDYSGDRFIPVRERIFIAPYTGEREITELEAFPVEYASDMYPKAESLIQRGRKFVEMISSDTGSHVECRGSDLNTKAELDEQMIIDMEQYWRQVAASEPRPSYYEPEPLDVRETGHFCAPVDWDRCPAASFYTTVADHHVDEDLMENHTKDCHLFLPFTTRSEKKQELTDDDLIIITYRLLGWCLHSRRWIRVHVDDVSKVERVQSEMRFNQLVLPPGTKQIIQAQVQEHFRKRSKAYGGEKSLDIVAGKGQGLMILLHGAPGVGKTATAECVADLVERPLFPLTCGDLGSTAREVEDKLSSNLYLATRWDCVLLLDEADVFMAKRSQQDHRRNATVSVFLRLLEYYKGILILTTNRIGTFDEAFKSRIHLSLFYPNFDEADTLAVWDVFIERTRKANASRSNFYVNAEEIRSFARKHYRSCVEGTRWNGRQIRNAFHTALAMAEYEAREKEKDFDETNPKHYGKETNVKVELGKSQFKKVAKTVRLFDEYMKDTLGNTYEEKMEHEKMRKTKYKESEHKKTGTKSKRPVSNSSSSDSSSSEDDRRKSKKKDAKKNTRKDSKRKDASVKGKKKVKEESTEVEELETESESDQDTEGSAV